MNFRIVLVGSLSIAMFAAYSFDKNFEVVGNWGSTPRKLYRCTLLRDVEPDNKEDRRPYFARSKVGISTLWIELPPFQRVGLDFVELKLSALLMKVNAEATVMKKDLPYNCSYAGSFAVQHLNEQALPAEPAMIHSYRKEGGNKVLMMYVMNSRGKREAVALPIYEELKPTHFSDLFARAAQIRAQVAQHVLKERERQRKSTLKIVGGCMVMTASVVVALTTLRSLLKPS